MAKRVKQVYQFKISLKDVKPPVWRRVQVPKDYSFWDMHVAIQDAMGWLDCHLHEFTMVDPSTGRKAQIGIPDDEFERDRDTLPGWECDIAKYFALDKRLAVYTYDFGDNWRHSVRLEEIVPREKDIAYPRCLAGRRACPPEDCGGPWGYEALLQILGSPGHEQHEEMRLWVGDDFDPAAFSAGKVSFDDPLSRWMVAFCDA